MRASICVSAGLIAAAPARSRRGLAVAGCAALLWPVLPKCTYAGVFKTIILGMQQSDLDYERQLRQREAYRRAVGIWLGLVVGLIFGVVSQTINLLVLPGLNLYQAPFGVAGNILLAVVLGGLLGGLCGWFFGSVEGVLTASAVGALLLLAAVAASGYRWELLINRIVAAFSLFLPVSAALVPALGLLRWVIDMQEEYRDLPPLDFQRVWRPVLIFLLAAGVGALWLLPEQGQRTLQSFDRLLRQAGESAQLPEPLRPPDVVGFDQFAQGSYTIQWERYNIMRFAIGYYPTAGWDPSAAVARFENGWSLVCIYTNPDLPPSCAGFGGSP